MTTAGAECNAMLQWYLTLGLALVLDTGHVVYTTCERVVVAAICCLDAI